MLVKISHFFVAYMDTGKEREQGAAAIICNSRLDMKDFPTGLSQPGINQRFLKLLVRFSGYPQGRYS